MEIKDIREEYAEQISTINKASSRSWAWAGLATVLLFATVTLVQVSGLIPAILLMEGAKVHFGYAAAAAIVGLATITAGKLGVSIDVDRDIQVEDINARRSAEYGAKAIVQELEAAGMAIEVKPKDTPEHDAPSKPKPQLEGQPEHIARLQTISLIKSQ
jgi:hypothetical protein